MNTAPPPLLLELETEFEQLKKTHLSSERVVPDVKDIAPPLLPDGNRVNEQERNGADSEGVCLREGISLPSQLDIVPLSLTH